MVPSHRVPESSSLVHPVVLTDLDDPRPSVAEPQVEPFGVAVGVTDRDDDPVAPPTFDDECLCGLHQVGPDPLPTRLGTHLKVVDLDRAGAGTTGQSGCHSGAVSLELRALRADDADHARAAHAELATEDFAFLPFFDADEAWDEYLARIMRLSRDEGLPPGIVPWTDLYGVVDGVVVGRVSVRHRLTESLERVGGHIGYGVRPAYRRRGYATALLGAGLVVAREHGIGPALVTCDDDNIGSSTVIERCGGVLEAVVTVADGRPKRRYWVPTR